MYCTCAKRCKRIHSLVISHELIKFLLNNLFLRLLINVIRLFETHKTFIYNFNINFFFYINLFNVKSLYTTINKRIYTFYSKSYT